ncbi:hypothetical protein ACFQY5_07725 [Paeniroseomonas aquatica]|uniref:Flagellar FliJ protein n=1 Tax=Paeniroseomonas aquatica TaxID=373043 RepID=A0ABT8ABY6_9PROT|nr:hypothetical protein [Paeniroseomonas aquatica]MDN3567071.1 hypothetical protein [Paeniroseomonas aquatica]
MARDPLGALARLRRLETTEAKRRLGEAFHRLGAAEARVAEASARLQAETVAAAPADYAAWLRRGLAERDRAGIAHGLARAGAATAQAVLAEARAAERGLDALREARQAAAAQGAERRAQALLDEAATRRRGPRA